MNTKKHLEFTKGVDLKKTFLLATGLSAICLVSDNPVTQMALYQSFLLDHTGLAEKSLEIKKIAKQKLSTLFFKISGKTNIDNIDEDDNDLKHIEPEHPIYKAIEHLQPETVADFVLIRANDDPNDNASASRLKISRLPIIIFNERAFANAHPQEISYVCAHEMGHLANGDIYYTDSVFYKSRNIAVASAAMSYINFMLTHSEAFTVDKSSVLTCCALSLTAHLLDRALIRDREFAADAYAIRKVGSTEGAHFF
jgi:Zn-dependent protease with chaperone function